MRRTTIALAFVPLSLTLALAAGCKRDDGRQATSTTTIRSGTPEPVRVIDMPLDAVATPEQAAVQFAWALCKHETECADAQAHMSAETKRSTHAACIAELKSPARMNVDTWDCAPAVARAGFEQCLATLANESCGARRIDNTSGLPMACRPAEICKRSSGITMK
jgi:hypothetical protein